MNFLLENYDATELGFKDTEELQVVTITTYLFNIKLYDRFGRKLKRSIPRNREFGVIRGTMFVAWACMVRGMCYANFPLVIERSHRNIRSKAELDRRCLLLMLANSRLLEIGCEKEHFQR